MRLSSPRARSCPVPSSRDGEPRQAPRGVLALLTATRLPSGAPCRSAFTRSSAAHGRLYPFLRTAAGAGAGAGGWAAGGITLSTCYFTLVHVHQSDTVREIELWGQRAHTSVAELLSAEAASVYTPKRRPVSPRSPPWPLLRLFWSLYVWWVTNVTSVWVRFAFWSPPPP